MSDFSEEFVESVLPLGALIWKKRLESFTQQKPENVSWIKVIFNSFQNFSHVFPFIFYIFLI